MLTLIHYNLSFKDFHDIQRFCEIKRGSQRKYCATIIQFIIGGFPNFSKIERYFYYADS